MDDRGHTTAPVSHGKATAPDRSPSPIHSSTSSVVAETSTGSQPIPSISSIRFFCSTTPEIVGAAQCWKPKAERGAPLMPSSNSIRQSFHMHPEHGRSPDLRPGGGSPSRRTCHRAPDSVGNVRLNNLMNRPSHDVHRQLCSLTSGHLLVSSRPVNVFSFHWQRPSTHLACWNAQHVAVVLVVKGFLWCIRSASAIPSWAHRAGASSS